MGHPTRCGTVIWKRTRVGIETDTVKIEIYHQGDEDGNGLVRHCQFPSRSTCCPRGRPSRGSGSPRRDDRCRGATTPWASRCGPGPRAWTRLEDLGDGRTRVYFRETYEAFNPVMRVLLEKRVHHFISKDNDRLIEASIVHSLKKLHEKKEHNT
jgi:hypothetical protein